MSAELDHETGALIKGEAYMGWLRNIPEHPTLYEAHFVPYDKTMAVVIVANTTAKNTEVMLEVIEALAVEYTQMLTKPRSHCSKIAFNTLNRGLWSLILAPMADDAISEEYPEHHVNQLFWADKNNAFPWDEAWSYLDPVQAILPRTTTVKH